MGVKLADGRPQRVVEVGRQPPAVLEPALAVVIVGSGCLHDPIKGQEFLDDHLLTPCLHGIRVLAAVGSWHAPRPWVRGGVRAAASRKKAASSTSCSSVWTTPDKMVMLERWASQELLDRHMEAERTRNSPLIDALVALWAPGVTPTVERFQV